MLDDSRDAAIYAATSAKTLVENLKPVDPQLAAQIEGKPSWAVKTPLAVALAAVISWVSTKYGLGLDETTTQAVTLIVIVVGGYVLRAMAKVPVTGLFKKRAL